jgi:hypothetical protein
VTTPCDLDKVNPEIAIGSLSRKFLFAAGVRGPEELEGLALKDLPSLEMLNVAERGEVKRLLEGATKAAKMAREAKSVGLLRFGSVEGVRKLEEGLRLGGPFIFAGSDFGNLLNLKDPRMPARICDRLPYWLDALQELGVLTVGESRLLVEEFKDFDNGMEDAKALQEAFVVVLRDILKEGRGGVRGAYYEGVIANLERYHRRFKARAAAGLSNFPREQAPLRGALKDVKDVKDGRGGNKKATMLVCDRAGKEKEVELPTGYCWSHLRGKCTRAGCTSGEHRWPKDWAGYTRKARSRSRSRR